MTGKRSRSLQQLHAREDEHLRRVIREGIKARREGLARTDCPFPGTSWKRNWLLGYDYEDKKQAEAK